MEDAAALDLMANFHGAIIPRGRERTYPNLVTMESVRGFEFMLSICCFVSAAEIQPNFHLAHSRLGQA